MFFRKILTNDFFYKEKTLPLKTFQVKTQSNAIKKACLIVFLLEMFLMKVFYWKCF